MRMLLGGRVGASVPRTRTGSGPFWKSSATTTSYMPGVSERRSSRTLMLAASSREGGDHHGELDLEASIGHSVLPLASAVGVPLCPIIYAT
jgi:hypothetical protein